jgi:hypothetical protein
MEQLAQAFGYALGAAILLVGKNLFDLVFKYIKQKKINTIFKRSINTSSIINEELSIIRDKFGFNRVSLIDYHNGTENFKGLSFKNASMRNEVVDVRTSRIISEFQNIPCSIVADMLIKLEESKKSYIVVGDNGDDQTSITHRMYGVKQAYNFKLGKTLVDGVVSCAFTDNKCDLTQDEIIEIKAIVQKIYLLRNKGK